MRLCVLLVTVLAACRLEPPAPSPVPAPGQTELTVAPNDETDRALVETVEARLRIDPTIDASRVDVDADDGRVRLFGTVASAAEKQRIVERAWVAGVIDVDASALDVRPFDEPAGSGPPEPEPTTSEEPQTEPGEVVFGPEL